jgi:hypothetical protein
MKLPTKLGREPVVEAVFEMRFATKNPASNILAQGTGSPEVYRLKSRSALPCAIRSRSATLTGRRSRNERASTIDSYG